MGWFQELINARLVNDEELIKEAFVDLSSSIMGERASYAILESDKKLTRGAIGAILAYYKAPLTEPPGDVEKITAQLDYMLRPSGILKRTVHLTEGWYKDSIGPILADRGGKVVALIPRGFSGYAFTDPETGKTRKVNKKEAARFAIDAFCFYKPMPQRAIGVKDLAGYMMGSLSRADILYFCMALLAVTLLGFAEPVVNKIIFASVIPAQKLPLLFSAAGLLFGVVFATFLLTMCKNLLRSRISVKVKLSLEAAFMGRLLILPTTFFKKYSTGEIGERMHIIGQFCDLVTTAIFSVGLASVFSLLYIIQIFMYAKELTIPALAIILVTLLFSLLVINRQAKLTSVRLAKNAKTSGLIFELISGIQKIKLVGGENRAFAQWAKKYKDIAKLDFDPPFILKSSAAFTGLITILGTALVYWTAARTNIDPADFMAFNVAYGMMSASILALSGMTLQAAAIGPILNLISPLMQTAPEASEEKEILTHLSGAIELNNVSFRYNENMPLVIDNLSLKIRKGEYVAIVGKTGCGKSTLLRILLGFEKPQLGSVYYDSRDLEKLDAKSVRKNIGVVMQNGKLLQGSIFENIAVSAPSLTLDEAWEAAEMAGLAEDLREMPMKMFTIVGEGGGGFSGGQKQRLLIARAIAAKPRILFFDEATSALDNITQKHVSEALGRLKSTRLVVAHRLSTIRRCDRIIVMDKGHIAEEGPYEELIKRKGIFAELVARQRIDQEEEAEEEE
jgi:NHLM bacteriocin system ABC transporter ATP-binding protein